MVKGISVRLLDITADSQNSKVMCGDIGIVFIQESTKEQIYTRYSKEFGETVNFIIIIV